MIHDVLSSCTHSQPIKHTKPLTIPAQLFNIHDIFAFMIDKYSSKLEVYIHPWNLDNMADKIT